MRASYWAQLKSLLWRNYLLKRRNMKQLWQEIFFPLMYLCILIMIKSLLKPAVKPPLSFPVNDLSKFHIYIGRSLFVVSNGLNVTSVMTRITTSLKNMDYEVFETESDAYTAYQSNKSIVAAGIIFDYNKKGKMQQYAIRLPYDSLADTKTIFTVGQNQGACRGDDNKNGTGIIQCKANFYLRTGFAYLQKTIDQALMKEFQIKVPDINVTLQMMPKDSYTPDLTYLQTISSIYFVLAYSFFINFLTVNLVAEKEKKIREGLFMMGLRNSIFWLSWSFVYFLIILVVTSVVTIIAAAAGFFQHSNMFLLWLMLMLYGLSIIALSFLFTPFFRKARVAGVVASFSTVIVSLIYLAVSQTRTPSPTGYTYSVSSGAQWAMCLLSPTALALAMDTGIFLDVARGGMTFENMTLGDFPLYAPIVMLVVDIFLYFLLAIYLDHVIPGEYGVRYKPWYFLQKSYWFSHRSEERLYQSSNQLDEFVALAGPNIEPVSSDMRNKRTMRITNISKVFKSKEKIAPAVQDMSLDMYEGQITALLGHNGAGKTTLINMLTGLMPPTSGTAIIRGLNITCSGDMEEIRSLCGICPQHNILYDELSAKEHLQIFAGIKGVPSDRIDAAVTKAMKSVDLEDQADVLASKLSGGQKRKLSVAMALIGDPKIIFLDEPTAGMDPYSRRHLWSLLKSSKEGRLILLTTHFMDEADILADRKVIISKGKLRCCGSSLFLKSKFGIGYHLNMVVEPTCTAEKVTPLLSSYVDGVQFQRSHGKELAYTIPISEVSKFADLFRALEKQDGSQTAAKSMGILNYGVSMPTLEEVFLKLGEDEEEEENDEGIVNPTFRFVRDTPLSQKQNEDHRLMTTQVNFQDPPELFSTLKEDKRKQTNLRFRALIKIRFLLVMRSKAAWFFMLVLPIGLVAGGLVLSKQSTAGSNLNPQALLLSSKLYSKSVDAPAEDLPNFLLQDSVGDAISKNISSSLQKFTKVDVFISTHINLSAVAPHFLGVNILGTDMGTNNLKSYTALYNDSALHSLPVIINTVSATIMEMAGSNESISTYSLPWPSSTSLRFDNGAFGSTIMVGMAFALIAPGFAVGIVQENQWKCKSQLRISGISFHMYWGTMFLFDLILYLIPATVCLILALTMKVPQFTPPGAIIMLVLLFILFIPQCLLLALVFTYFFSKYETAQAVMPNMFIMGGMLPYLAVSLVDMLAAERVATALHYVLVFTDPVYIIFGGFYYIEKIYRISTYTNADTSVADYFSFKNNIVICLIACVLDFVLMYLLLRILEVRSNGGKVLEALRFGDTNIVHDVPVTNTDVIQGEEEDVAKERDRVEHLQNDTQNVVAYVQQIRKEFIKTGKSSTPCIKPPPEKIKIAVRNLSFAVNKGEVFGLLGPNGAGKTTALSMMTAEVHPTQGKVVIADHEVRSNMSDAFQVLGFCPQHDALWESITLAEHLELYAAIKGISSPDSSLVINYFIENLKIESHRNKHAKKLSGGTKRKLSYAMSMLSWPKVVLLDEPSTGMDPQSKRFLWDVISNSFEGQDRGAILTTHNMEEADALCSRVAIMVNGQMECLGPTQHLKTKYGSGYILEVKVAGGGSTSNEELEQRIQNLKQHLITLFPGATCLESFAERAQYKIPQSDVDVLSNIFAALESTKESHGVEEYSFSQSTLEQVFLNFAKKQLEEGAEPTSAQALNSPERRLLSPVNSVRGNY